MSGHVHVCVRERACACVHARAFFSSASPRMLLSMPARRVGSTQAAFHQVPFSPKYSLCACVMLPHVFAYANVST
jgi:hypothetical protein